MIEQQPTTIGEHVYRVEVGHCAMQVQSTSIEGAIDKALYRFMRELPRLWDVIQKLEPSRFRVTML
jgi:hypothetical protein